MKEHKIRRKRLIKNRKAEIIVHFLLLAAAIAAVLYAVWYWRGQKVRTTEPAGNSPQKTLVGDLPVSTAESSEETAEPTLESFQISVKQVPEFADESAAEAVQELADISTAEAAEEVESTAAEVRAGLNGDAEITDVDCDWRLILVNTEHLLPDDYVVNTVTIGEESDVRFDERAAESLIQMMQDCENAGYSFIIRSSYRTMQDQQELFERKTQEYLSQGMSQEDAEREAATVVAYPGTSEHQLGLAADIVSSENIELETDQENTETQQWLMKNCWRYGFILRYPTTKSSITGIIYEPWHYRYVGVGAAKVMYEENLCLEEYLEKYGNQEQPEGTGYVSANGRNGWEEVS